MILHQNLVEAYHLMFHAHWENLKNLHANYLVELWDLMNFHWILMFFSFKSHRIHENQNQKITFLHLQHTCCPCFHHFSIKLQRPSPAFTYLSSSFSILPCCALSSLSYPYVLMKAGKQKRWKITHKKSHNLTPKGMSYRCPYVPMKAGKQKRWKWRIKNRINNSQGGVV